MFRALKKSRAEPIMVRAGQYPFLKVLSAAFTLSKGQRRMDNLPIFQFDIL
jgi:hypothetical protein